MFYLKCCQQMNSLRAGLFSTLHPQYLANRTGTARVCWLNEIEHSFVRLKPLTSQCYNSPLHYFYRSFSRIMSAEIARDLSLYWS